MLKKVSFYCCLVIILAACGNKGDLYIPVSDCDTGQGEFCNQQETQ